MASRAARLHSFSRLTLVHSSFSLQEAVTVQKEVSPLHRSHLRCFSTALGVLLALVLSFVPGYAQSTQGAILGSVKDPVGATISGAEVTLTNTDEGIVRTTKSNAF